MALLLLPPPGLALGFVLMMAALFTAQSLASGAAGRRGAGVSGAYVAAFYLGAPWRASFTPSSSTAFPWPWAWAWPWPSWPWPWLR